MCALVNSQEVDKAKVQSYEQIEDLHVDGSVEEIEIQPLEDTIIEVAKRN